MKKLLLFVLLFMLSLTSVSAVVECYDDQDCSSAEICDYGRCVSPIEICNDGKR